MRSLSDLGVGFAIMWGDWTSIPTSAVQALKQAVEAACGMNKKDFLVVAPSRHMSDLFFREDKIASVMAILPRALKDACFQFIDARELAIPVMAVVLPALPTTINRLISIAGGTRAEGLHICVYGAPFFDERSCCRSWV